MGKKFPIIMGINVIDRTMKVILPGKFNHATVTWRQAYLSTILSQSLSYPKGPFLTTMAINRSVTHMKFRENQGNCSVLAN